MSTKFHLTIEQMLRYPEMHAQNPASLEDQFTLLCSFIDKRLQQEYVEYCRTPMKMATTAASRDFNTFPLMVEYLETFYQEFVAPLPDEL